MNRCGVTIVVSAILCGSGNAQEGDKWNKSSNFLTTPSQNKEYPNGTKVIYVIGQIGPKTAITKKVETIWPNGQSTEVEVFYGFGKIPHVFIVEHTATKNAKTHVSGQIHQCYVGVLGRKQKGI